MEIRTAAVVLLAIGALLFLPSPLIALHGAKRVRGTTEPDEKRKGLGIMLIACVMVTVGLANLLLGIRYLGR